MTEPRIATIDFAVSRPRTPEPRSISPTTTAEIADYALYPSRWYVILVFSFLSMMQCAVWNQWGPIFGSMRKILYWSDTQLAVLPFCGTVMFTLCVMPCVWLTERFGMRRSVIAMALMVLVSLLLRCIWVDNVTLQNVLINISAVLNGIAGAYTTYAPSVISARWFAPNERKIATSLGILINGAGVAVSFLAGPYAVPVPPTDSAEDRTYALHRYFYYTYVETGISLLLAICIFMYFPSYPPKPPSPSAAEDRISDVKSMIQVIKHGEFWLLATPTLLILGTFLGWQPVLGICLDQNGVNQIHAGWMGCWSSVASVVVGLLTAKLADTFPSNIKAIMIAFTVLTLEGVVWILLLNQNFLTFGLISMYIAVILAGAASGAIFPLSLEFAAEICYPVDETTVAGFVGCLINAVCSIFLAIIFIPNISLAWMTWFLAIACGIALPVTLFLPTNYRRSNVDGITTEAVF